MTNYIPRDGEKYFYGYAGGKNQFNQEAMNQMQGNRWIPVSIDNKKEGGFTRGLKKIGHVAESYLYFGDKSYDVNNKTVEENKNFWKIEDKSNSNHKVLRTVMKVLKAMSYIFFPLLFTALIVKGIYRKLSVKPLINKIKDNLKDEGNNSINNRTNGYNESYDSYDSTEESRNKLVDEEYDSYDSTEESGTESVEEEYDSYDSTEESGNESGSVKDTGDISGSTESDDSNDNDLSLSDDDSVSNSVTPSSTNYPSSYTSSLADRIAVKTILGLGAVVGGVNRLIPDGVKNSKYSPLATVIASTLAYNILNNTTGNHF